MGGGRELGAALAARIAAGFHGDGPGALEIEVFVAGGCAVAQVLNVLVGVAFAVGAVLREGRMPLVLLVGLAFAGALAGEEVAGDAGLIASFAAKRAAV